VALHRTRQAGAEHFRRIIQQPAADECLNEHVFLTLAEARETIETWRYDYNHLRPHSNLGALTPIEFAMLKRQQQQSPLEGQNHDRLYL
jgi:transposase InsO family protein